MKQKKRSHDYHLGLQKLKQHLIRTAAPSKKKKDSGGELARDFVALLIFSLFNKSSLIDILRSTASYSTPWFVRVRVAFIAGGMDSCEARACSPGHPRSTVPRECLMMTAPYGAVSDEPRHQIEFDNT